MSQSKGTLKTERRLPPASQLLRSQRNRARYPQEGGDSAKESYGSRQTRLSSVSRAAHPQAHPGWSSADVCRAANGNGQGSNLSEGGETKAAGWPCPGADTQAGYSRTVGPDAGTGGRCSRPSHAGASRPNASRCCRDHPITFRRDPARAHPRKRAADRHGANRRGPSCSCGLCL